jgi:uncharacterized protein YcaQ
MFGKLLMLTPLELSQAQGRKIALISQGLHKKRPFGSGLQASFKAIEHLSYLQIDSISVIQRAHHHCLWSRVQDHQPKFIDELVKQKQIFEYWSHAAAYLPMADYRFSLLKKHAIASGEKHWRDKDQVAEKRVIERIRQEGPLQAKDFESETSKKSTGWWDWKPDKVALEQLFIEGQLMVTQRRGFQKVYDLTERVLPADIDTSVPTAAEFEQHLVLRYLQAHGLGKVEQISYQRKGLKSRLTKTCERMLENGQLLAIKIGSEVYYALAEVFDLLKQPVSRKQVHILSPFDNVLIQRKRLSEIFDFDYQIECYVPKQKRKYGYFSLPLLWGNQFVGRMDAKIQRKIGVLEVNNLQIETTNTGEFIEALRPVLHKFMLFNQGTRCEVHQVKSHEPLSGPMQKYIKQQLQIFS